MSKRDAYQEYQEKVFSKISIPEEMFNRVVESIAGSTPSTKEKILKGEVNQVFGVVAEDGQKIIVRISKNGDDFWKEKIFIGKCKKLGVPVPKILGIKEAKLGEEKVFFCVMEKIEGDTLLRGNIKMEKLDEKVVRNIFHQAGEILGKIHSIPVEGFGWLSREGKGNFKTFTELLTEHVSQGESYRELAKKYDLSSKVIDESLVILDQKSRFYTGVEPQLNHGDFDPKHWMIKDGKIVGILDFGGVRGDSPADDFAYLYYWHPEWKQQLEWMKEGYPNQGMFDKNFEEIVHLIKLNFGLGLFYWYDHEDFKQGTERAKEKLIEDLKFFNGN